jgi:hypothetical protein
MDENLLSRLVGFLPPEQRFLISTLKSGETDQIYQLVCRVELPFNLATRFWLFQALKVMNPELATSTQNLFLNLSLSQKAGLNCLKNYPLVQITLMRF